MVSDRFKRPSVIVAAWAAVVIAVFVVRGDLRIARASEVPTVQTPLVGREPLIVRRPVSARPIEVATIMRRGRIFDALGFLVVGAEVVPMDRAALRTDGDGAFEVAMTPGATTDLLVRADGQQPAWLRMSEGSPDVLALQLMPTVPWEQAPTPLVPPSSLRGEGTARGADGKPLAGAFVTAMGTGVWARADDIGRFMLPLPSPLATLLLHAPHGGVGETGFYGTSAPLVNDRTQGAVPVPDLIAAPGLAIRGIVRDARGVPIVGVPIEITGSNLRRVVEAGSGGAFSLGGLVAGDYQARPFAYRGAVGIVHNIELRDASVDVDLQLAAAEEVRLRVVDERGSPVAGVFVATSVGGARRGVAQADSDGWAAVPVATQTQFDVRTPAHFAAVTVRRFDADPATLIVAMP